MAESTEQPITILGVGAMFEKFITAYTDAREPLTTDQITIARGLFAAGVFATLKQTKSLMQTPGFDADLQASTANAWAIEAQLIIRTNLTK